MSSRFQFLNRVEDKFSSATSPVVNAASRGFNSATNLADKIVDYGASHIYVPSKLQSLFILLIILVCFVETQRTYRSYRWMNMWYVKLVMLIVVVCVSITSPVIGLLLFAAYFLHALSVRENDDDEESQAKQVRFGSASVVNNGSGVMQSIHESIASLSNNQVLDNSINGASGLAYDAVSGVESGLNSVLNGGKQLYSDF